MEDSNAVWTLDFKAQFQTGDGQRCYLMTLIVGFSRYLLRCQALRRPITAAVQPLRATSVVMLMIALRGRTYGQNRTSGPVISRLTESSILIDLGL